MLLAPSHYRKAARNSLAAVHKPGRVILIHSGVMMLTSLLLMLVDYFLDQQISSITGIRGMNTRSVLTTIQIILRFAHICLLPFWQIGYTYYTLRVARGENAGLGDLWEGFRRWFPILRLKLLMGAMLFLLSSVTSYLASIIFCMTPWAAPMMAEMEALLAEGRDYMEISEILMARMQDFVFPLIAIFCVLFAVGGIVLFFFYRQAELWLLDHPGQGAFAALRGSRHCMRGNKKGMLRIDLSYWWFYLLEVLISVLSMGDVILDALGLEMSNDTFVILLVFYCLYLWAQLMLYWWKRNEVAVTYAHAYLALCSETSETEIKV